MTAGLSTKTVGSGLALAANATDREQAAIQSLAP